MNHYLFTTLTLFALLNMAPLQAETPAEGLARYEQTGVFGPESKGKNLTDDERKAICLDVAQKHGVALIPLILDRSTKWTGEEGLFYMRLILNLPIDAVVVIFEKGLHDPNPKKALWSREFLIEIESYLEDTTTKVSKLIETEGRIDGGKEAEADFQKGIYRILSRGLRLMEDGKPSAYETYLKEKYGVTFKTAAACAAESLEEARIDGYNETMEKLLLDHFKKDIFAEAKMATEQQR